MAKRSPLTAARGALVSMVLLMIVMAAGIFGTTQAGGSWGPKLALDLSGGTQMILSPKVNGSQNESVSQEQLNQAVEIIRQRVDGAGVSEAEVTTSFGSGNNVVVSVPGTISAETRALIQASANMSFRPVLASGCRKNTRRKTAPPGIMRMLKTRILENRLWPAPPTVPKSTSWVVLSSAVTILQQPRTPRKAAVRA